MGRVSSLTANDDTLPMLTGIRLDTAGQQLTLAATDRYRIAVTDTTWTPDGDSNLSAMIPGRHLHDTVKGIGHGTVTIGLNDQLASLTTADRQTTVRLLDEQFIDYRPRVTLDASTTATVDAPVLAAAVKRVAIVAERSTAIRLAFTDGQVRVQAGAADVGRGGDTVDCTLDGDPIDIAFQSQYLLDGLTVAGGTVRIGMTEPLKPALISSEDETYRYLVMALRLS
jgi:DNA polymerase-3 subunit beta